VFNGIIKNIGKINKISKKKNSCVIEIYSKIKFTKKDIGSSLSCSGACLTLEEYKGRISKFYISKETLNKTIFKSSKKGDIINFEKSIIYGDRLSGHFVQGHVDTTSKIRQIKYLGKSWIISFLIKKKYMKNIVSKGSISINGVSLTIANLNRFGFEVALIPKTLKLTNLIYLKKGDIVNIEFDIIGKYIKKYVK